jgi:hypothetical protein
MLIQIEAQVYCTSVGKERCGQSFRAKIKLDCEVGGILLGPTVAYRLELRQLPTGWGLVLGDPYCPACLKKEQERVEARRREI